MDFQEIKYFNNLPNLLTKNSEKIEQGSENIIKIKAKNTRINFEEIGEIIKSKDYCIVTFNSSLNLEQFAKKATFYFGDLVLQTQKPESFIYSVEYNPLVNSSTAQLNSNKAQPVHTDGHFKKNPPKYLCLYCCEQAEKGGCSQMVFVDDVYNYIKSLSLKIAEDLFDVLIEYSRKGPTGNLFRYKKKLLFKRDDGKIGISYNPIMYEIKANREIEQALTLINYFTNRPSSQTIFKLKPNEMLLLDNERVLHGRTGFDKFSRRKLQRLWFSGKTERNEFQ